jgi:type IV fimbrial biogenesis protein FimT
MTHRSAGFTIIELMIAITLMGILLVMGIPAFSTYGQNLKIRNSVQAFVAGLQKARGEALQRNTRVDFVLTNDDVSGPGFGGVTASSTGTNWLVRTNDLSTFIEGKAGVEGTASTANAVQVAGTDTGGAPVSMVVFTGLGATTLTTAATFSFTNPTGGTCTGSGGSMRCLNVVVSVGGQSRICDPDPSVPVGDTRRC